jgi:hypothetical protein
MNSALCLLMYGAVMAWLCPPLLVRVTRSGSSPRLSVAVWISAVVLALGAWFVAGLSLLVEVVSTHALSPVQYCLDMLLALNHLGWAGHLIIVAASAGAVVTLVAVLRRLWVTARRLWARSSEHAHAARLLGSATSRPGVVLVQADQPTAYCVAGRPHAIVVTTGAVASLSEQELSAVLAHEQAHLSGRHPQLMMALRALSSSLPRIPLLARASESVAAMLEMCADDRAARQHGRDALLRSLATFAGITGQTPGGALGIADTAVLARALRLAGPAGRWARLRSAALLSAVLAALVTTPAVITLICHS